mmetsp:Transcript_18376/g.27422  ORF Transcript_18376/g.27422 Transcript_18376/m.27422 type:complete len:297 (-) Transcript_18376:175-1065(-)
MTNNNPRLPLCPCSLKNSSSLLFTLSVLFTATACHFHLFADAYSATKPTTSVMRSLKLSCPFGVVSSSCNTATTQSGMFLSLDRTVSLSTNTALHMGKATIEQVPDNEEAEPLVFVDTQGAGFIECYADSIATVDDVEYIIGSPCDYAVALCYFDEDDQLVPVELDDDLMDDVFPVAANIVADEFGDELALMRTPQTLTLVGELEDEEDDEEEEDESVDMDDGEEEVEVLISFDHKGMEFDLVRLLDPVLLVGKPDPDSDDPQRRLLLTPQESSRIMPQLETLFLEFQGEQEGISF